MPTKFENMIMDQYIQTVYGPADDFTQMGTEMAGGTEPPGATPMTLGEFATSAADVPAGLLKGAVQGTIGLPGDIESLAYGVRELFRRGADESRFDAFLRGIESGTVMPTTEDVKKWMDTNVGPLVPAGASERRREAAKIPEFVGELGGAGQTVIEGSRAAARGARQIGREIATTPPTGAVQMAPTPVQAPKSEIGFYSAVEETVANLPQAKGTGQQFLAQISKTAGVKPEELQWTGLDEFLKGKKSVTKQEIQDYLNANRVDVQEVQLGQNNAYTEWGKKLAQAKRSQESAKINMELTLPDLSPVNYYNLRDMWAGPAARGDQEALSKIRSLGLTPEQEANVLDYGRQVSLVSELKGSAPPNLNPKFSNYTLPGGENYREILLTLPGGPRQTKFEVFDPSTQRAVPFETREEAVAFANQDPTRSSVVAEVDVSKPEYRSRHFDQPNILAHMRVNDRVVDGKKTLFIEEIQSDWHQAGRKKGYSEPGKPFEVFDPRDGSVISRFATEREAKEYADQLGPQVDYARSEGVPDAPFKTSWHELTLKRAIQEASEKGYDQIAFTTGKTQAERYDLSKQVSTLRAPYDNGEYVVSYIPKGGNDYEYMGRFLEKDLPGAVGKELAEKIVANKNVQTMTYKGDDLRVGGEGMKGFYDNILPKSLEKLGKKFDAKVGKTEMDGVEVWQMDITPKMRESAMSKGQPLFVAPVVAPGMVQDEESK